MPGDCPKGGNHNWVNIAETADKVTHQCTKCKTTSTRAKGKSDHVGRVYAVALLVMTALAVALTIWAGGAS